MVDTFCNSNSDIKFSDALWAELVTHIIDVLNWNGKSTIGKFHQLNAGLVNILVFVI